MKSVRMKTSKKCQRIPQGDRAYHTSFYLQTTSFPTVAPFACFVRISGLTPLHVQFRNSLHQELIGKPEQRGKCKVSSFRAQRGQLEKLQRKVVFFFFTPPMKLFTSHQITQNRGPTKFENPNTESIGVFFCRIRIAQFVRKLPVEV